MFNVLHYAGLHTENVTGEATEIFQVVGEGEGVRCRGAEVYVLYYINFQKSRGALPLPECSPVMSPIHTKH